MTRKRYEKEFPDKPIGDFVGNWKNEVLSDALGVHSSQAKEAEAEARALGVPTEYLPDGRPVIRSTAHRRELLKAMAKAGHKYRPRNEFY